MKRKKREKLSIIVPVYNESETVDKLLKKVEAVKLPIKKEIIIVESNSTDGSRVDHDKTNPRTEIEITRLEVEECYSE